MNLVKRTSHWIRKVGMLVILGILGIGLGWAQEHDLLIGPAPNLTSASSADWKSPDIKIGADFGSTSVPDLVQRGVPNDIYVRFRVNGMLDHTVVSGSIKVKFYWCVATPVDSPPVLTETTTTGWTLIAQLAVTYIPDDGPFTVTRVWPTDFPSVVSKSVAWTPMGNDEYYYIGAVLVYPAGTTDANPSDNVAISRYESKSGLLDVVLLHDVTGSMGYYNYGGYPYIDLAKSKASVFLASMNEIHNFSVVAFSSNYPSGYEEIWPTAVPWLRPGTTPNKNNALAAIAGLTAYGATPLGQGLERAIDILTNSGPDRKRVIILLSDGEENTGTPLACSGAASTPCVGGTLMTDLLANQIKVFTIALGTYANTQCLECLANQTGGQWYSSPDASIELTDVLLAVQQAASADDLYRVDRGVSGGGDDTYSTYFEGKDNALYFILSWDDLNADLELKIEPPGGGRQPNMEIFRGKGYQVVKVKKSARVRWEGTWTYSVTGADGKKYLAAVRSDRVGVTLRMETFAEGIVGTPIKIKAHLTDAGRPITNAQVMATVQVPVHQSLQTILQNTFRDYLQETQVYPIDPRQQLEKPDISPQTAFISKILGDRQYPLVKTESMQVVLQHVGKGVYEGVLKDRYTATAGEYNVVVTCADQRYHRNFSKTLRIQPGEIDYEKSYAQVVKVRMPRVQEPTWLLQVYAVDRFGNAVTVPSLRERVRVDVKGARIGKPQILFGTFQQQFQAVEGERPEIKEVILDGKKIRIEER